MPFSKCQFYEVDGTPINGGCRRIDECQFIHPSHPDWAEARDCKFPPGGRGRGSRGRGRGGTANQPSTSSGWSAPPSSTPSTWGSTDVEPRLSWADPPVVDSSSSNANAWAETAQETGTQSDAQMNGWGVTTSVSGWGGPPSTGNGTWGDTIEGGGTSDVTAVDANDGREIGGVTEEGQGQDMPAPGQHTTLPSPVLPVTPRPQPEDIEMRDVAPLSPTAHRRSFSMAWPGSPTGTDTTTSTRARPSRPRAKEPVGPVERRNTWEHAVKATTKAVIAYSAMGEAEKERDRYKPAQASNQYARVGAKGRQMLDEKRKDLEEQIVKHSKELKRHLDTLEQLPEMSNTFLDLSSKVDEHEISSYVVEIKDWIETTRPLVLKVTATAPTLAPESSPSKAPDHSIVEDGQINEMGDGHPTPAKRRHTSPELHSTSNILAWIARLEAQVEDIEANLPRHIQPPEMVRMVQDNAEVMRVAKMAHSADPVHQLSNKAAELDDRITSEAGKTAVVLELQGKTKMELEVAREEHRQLLLQQAQGQQQCVDLRKELDENSALMERIKGQMQQLLVQHEGPTLHISKDTRDRLSAIAQVTINEEVDPAINRFRETVTEQITGQHKEIYNTLWQKLEPSLKLTDRIYQWLESQIQKQPA